ncbi:hypothetical protein M1N79_00670 [Dehalococcoidia bacterium]|nr:hypothetical protein [Dehalococcoidia bacterium]MCL0089117.1 hypothetical protein [Dehalococcoidia bacterium]
MADKIDIVRSKLSEREGKGCLRLLGEVTCRYRLCPQRPMQGDRRKEVVQYEGVR